MGGARRSAADRGLWPADSYRHVPASVGEEANRRPSAESSKFMGHTLDLSKDCAAPGGAQQALGISQSDGIARDLARSGRINSTQRHQGDVSVAQRDQSNAPAGGSRVATRSNGGRR